MTMVKKTFELHEWPLREYQITEIIIDPSSLRLQLWTLEASAEIRLGVPFEYTDIEGRTRTLDPDKPEQLAPMLTLIGRRLDSLTVSRTGELVIRLGEGSSIRCGSHEQYEAWEVHGSGHLADMAYLCSPGGGSPWGAAA